MDYFNYRCGLQACRYFLRVGGEKAEKKRRAHKPGAALELPARSTSPPEVFLPPKDENGFQANAAEAI